MKPRFLPDTSCIIAAVSGWHADHLATLSEIQRRLSLGEEMVAAAPALIEAYAVLTRLPAAQRLAPDHALATIEAGFIARRRVIALTYRDYLRLLRGSPSAEVFGGRTYDSVIAECAVKARVSALLTLNADHFQSWASDQMKVVVPAAQL